MSQHIDAAFFDIDRTLIASDTQRLHDGLDEVLNIERRPFDITEVTARGLLQYQRALRENPSLMPSAGYPVGLEYGTQIVTSSDYNDVASYTSLHHSALSSHEQQQLVGYLETCPFIFAAFYSHDPTVPRTLWLAPAVRQEDVAIHDKDRASVYQGAVSALARAMEDAQPGMVVVRTPQVQEYEALPLTTYATSFSGTTTIDFLPAGTDKRNAVLHMEDLLGLQRERMLTAGDSLPDLGMLAIEGVKSILVHNPKVNQALFPPHAVRVMPAELSALLQEL